MDEPQPYDTGDQHQVDTKKKRLKLAAERSDSEFVAMMEVAGFRTFLWRLLGTTHLFESSTGGDPHHTYFREGERNIGLMLMADINRLCPDKYLLMAGEARKRDEELNG